jgi:hypothetical protein
MGMCQAGQRTLQERYGGCAVAGRLEQRRVHRTWTDEDRECIETAPFFLLATAWHDSVDCAWIALDWFSSLRWRCRRTCAGDWYAQAPSTRARRARHSQRSGVHRERMALGLFPRTVEALGASS